MKKMFALVLALAMALSLAACGGGNDTPPSNNGGNPPATTPGADSTPAPAAPDGASGSVYWLNFKPEADADLQKIAQTYTSETGVPVKVVTAASGTYESTLTAEMDKSSAPTLFVVGNAAAVKTWDSYCYDLNGTDIYNELSTDSFTLRNADGKVCSIGYCYESFGIIVNKALLEQAGHSLDEITNFESLKAVAEDIHARAGELGFDAFTSSGLDDSSSWRFSGHLANMPLFYQSRDAGGWTECPATISNDYLDNFKAIWDLYINNSAADPSSLATSGYDAEAEFGTGKAVFYQNGTWEYSNLVTSDETGYHMNPDDLAMIPIYCGVDGEENAGLCSGTENCWAVNANASEEDIKATIDFMVWLATSDAGTKVMAEQFGPIPYKGAAATGNVFFNDANKYMSAGNYTVDWTFNYTPNVNDWRAAVVNAMVQYCAGGDWANVETAMVAGWASQYQAANG
ncbi:MAG: ABC transporter substrate-binding protein [Oscillospiraceae bacterium]|nr:ABC transporter substrate-binding protein [Oscillospiraceae bacterium]